jgi:hypothetical protein
LAKMARWHCWQWMKLGTSWPNCPNAFLVIEIPVPAQPRDFALSSGSSFASLTSAPHGVKDRPVHAFDSLVHC